MPFLPECNQAREVLRGYIEHMPDVGPTAVSGLNAVVPRRESDIAIPTKVDDHFESSIEAVHVSRGMIV